MRWYVVIYGENGNTHTHTHTYIYIYTHTHIHIHKHTHTHTHIYIYIHIHKHTHTHTHTPSIEVFDPEGSCFCVSYWSVLRRKGITITGHGISNIKNRWCLSVRIDIGLNFRKFNLKNAFKLRYALKQQEEKLGNCSVLIFQIRLLSFYTSHWNFCFSRCKFCTRTVQLSLLTGVTLSNTIISLFYIFHRISQNQAT